MSSKILLRGQELTREEAIELHTRMLEEIEILEEQLQ